ncbi:Phage repressor protein [Gammaproteobacteria bacterium]
MRKSESIGEVIRALRKQLGKTQAEFAVLAGVTKGAVSQWENNISSPERDAIASLASHGIETGQILFQKSARGGSNAELGPRIRGYIPLISWVQAGNFSDCTEGLSAADAEEWMPCPVDHGPKTFALKVKGESMYNPHGATSFKEGEIIFVDPDRPARNGSFVVVHRDAQREATFKKIILEGDKSYLKPLNPDWPGPKIIELDEDTNICGVVIFKGEKL